MPERVCVGIVVGAQGLRGVVRIKSFTESPADVAAYGPVEDEAGRRFRLRVVGEAKGVVLAQPEGIADRTGAEAMKGRRLYVARAALPPPAEEEYYHSDLVGLRAEREDGSPLGEVTGVFDFGGGDLIEVAGPEGKVMMPFTHAVVPVVDLSGGRVVVVPPVMSGGTDGDEADDA